MKSKLIFVTSLLAQVAPGLSQASDSPLCTDIVNLQPIEYDFLQPILIDSFFPANTDIVLDDGHVIHVTDAPTSLNTVLTDVSTSLTILTSVANGNTPGGGYITYTVPADPRDIGNHPVTKTYPATEPGQPGVVIIQTPTSPPKADGVPTSVPYVTVTTTGDFPSLTTQTISPNKPGATGSVIVEVPSSTPYVTTTTTGDFPSLTTKTVTPNKPGATGTVIVEVPTTSPGPSSASFVTVTSPGAPTDSTRTSTISPSGSNEPGTVIVVVPSSQAPPASSVPFVTVTTTESTLNPTDGPVTSTISPSGSSGTGTVIVEVPPSNFPASSVPFVTVTTTEKTLNPTDDPVTSTIPPTGSASTGTVMVEVPPSSSPSASSVPLVTRTVTGDDGNGEPSTTTILPTTSGGSGTVIVEVPPSTNSPPSPAAETSSPSQSPSDGNPSSTPASLPASSSATSSNPASEAPSSPTDQTSNPATSSAPSSTSSPSDTETSSPANPSTSSPASSAQTSSPGSSTESAPSSTSSEAASDYDPCPDSLYGNPECCSVDALGVADVECDSPTESPTDADNFQAICAARGKRARCCVLPVLGQALVCMTPVGVSD